MMASIIRVIAASVLSATCIALIVAWLWMSVMTAAFAGGFHVPHRLSDLSDAPVYYSVSFGAPVLAVLLAVASVRLWRIRIKNA